MSKLETYDKNMAAVKAEGNLNFFDPKTNPAFRIEGLPWFETNKNYHRLPDDSAGKVSDGVYWLMKQPAGGMIRFKTNSSQITLRMRNLNDYQMSHMAACGQQGADLYYKRACDSEYLFSCVTKFAEPATEYDMVVFRADEKEDKEILIHLPLYEELDEILVGLDTDATLCAPCDRARPGKVAVYGTSITQGGCASRPGMAYTNILSRRLDIEFVNLGFSGSGLGEPVMGEYLRQIPDVKLFVLDYDANGGRPGTLEKYIDELVANIRAGYPETPILIVSKPPFTLDLFVKEYADVRKRLVNFQRNFVESHRATDKNLYFFDGNGLFGDRDIYEMTVDGTHPTDLGFYTMANTLTPVFRSLLDGKGI